MHIHIVANFDCFRDSDFSRFFASFSPHNYREHAFFQAVSSRLHSTFRTRWHSEHAERFAKRDEREITASAILCDGSVRGVLLLENFLGGKLFLPRLGYFLHRSVSYYAMLRINLSQEILASGRDSNVDYVDSETKRIQVKPVWMNFERRSNEKLSRGKRQPREPFGVEASLVGTRTSFEFEHFLSLPLSPSGSCADERMVVTPKYSVRLL